MENLHELQKLLDILPRQGGRMPVLFTSHGNPFDITKGPEERPFWQILHQLGATLQSKLDIKAVVVVSAHWCTEGTLVNVSQEQTQIYDYYGFPPEYYEPIYKAQGAPQVAHELRTLAPQVQESHEWGLDHGAWPMLMHLFPRADVPVFQVSLSYHASPQYHFDLAQQLKALRSRGVLVIGSGSLIHNLALAGRKMRTGDMSPYGWEAEYDAWIGERLRVRDHEAILNYTTSHPLGKLAAPTPDHFVPVLYTLGLSDSKDDLAFFYQGESTLPAFSERSFIMSDHL